MPTKLPKLSKSLAEIRADLYRRMNEVQDEFISQGYLPQRLNLNKGVARGLIELFAFGLWQLYQVLEKTMQEAVPKNSASKWLDVHCDQVGIHRKQSQKACGNIAFYRADLENKDRNIVISKGRIVKTLADGEGEIYRYVTLENAVIRQGEDFVLIPCESEGYGKKNNAAPNQICELVTSVEGVGKIDNFSDWLTKEASDEENDIQLQRRYALAFSSQAGMTRAAYENAALSVNGVEDVFISDQHPRGEGTLDIVVQGANGIPTENLLEEVRKAVASHIVINDDVLVKSPDPVLVDISMQIELLSGSEAEIKAQAAEYIQKLFSCDYSVPYFGIGKDVILSRIEAGIINLPGVKRIVWNIPTADVTIQKEQMAKLGSLNIEIVWVTEA